MVLLHIEHSVVNFDRWKSSFDTFAELRQKSGVRRFRVSRPVDNPNFAIIDLELDSLGQAEALLGAVQQVWKGAAATIINNPAWQISEIIETKELQ